MGAGEPGRGTGGGDGRRSGLGSGNGSAGPSTGSSSEKAFGSPPKGGSAAAGKAPAQAPDLQGGSDDKSGMLGKARRIAVGTAANLTQGSWEVAKAGMANMKEAAADRIGETTGGRIAAAIRGDTSGTSDSPVVDATAGGDDSGSRPNSRAGMLSKLREAANRLDQAGGADAPAAAFEQDRLTARRSWAASTPMADEATAFVNRSPGATS